MENAIKKAIEGGYRSSEFPNYRSRTAILSYRDYEKGGAYSIEQMKWSDILLDPLFWQALGNNQGWGFYEEKIEEDEWRDKWHNFIDHLAEGKSINSFFENLLVNPKGEEK